MTDTVIVTEFWRVGAGAPTLFASSLSIRARGASTTPERLIAVLYGAPMRLRGSLEALSPSATAIGSCPRDCGRIATGGALTSAT